MTAFQQILAGVDGTAQDESPLVRRTLKGPFPLQQGEENVLADILSVSASQGIRNAHPQNRIGVLPDEALCLIRPAPRRHGLAPFHLIYDRAARFVTNG